MLGNRTSIKNKYGGIINFGIYPRTIRRERFIFEELLTNLFKTYLFLVFWLNSRFKEGIWDENSKMELVLTIQGLTVKIPLQSTRKLRIFQFCPSFSCYPLLKSGMSTPIEIIYSKLQGQIFYFTKFRVLKLKIVDSGSI